MPYGKCTWEDCIWEGPLKGRGMCARHYTRWLRTQRTKKCSIEGCDKLVNSRGWCIMHYHRWQRNGDPLIVQQIVGDGAARLQSYIDVRSLDECWPWTGTLNKRGYAVINNVNGEWLGHRAAYVTFVGPIPNGMTIDHLCHKHDECSGGDGCLHRRCCNWVSHLGLASQGANVLRGNAPSAINARMVMCGKGLHLLDETNTVVSKSGKRRCRACHLEWRRQRRAAGLSS